MNLLQLTAGQGPEECCKAVDHALNAIKQECKNKRVTLSIVDSRKSKYGFHSVLIELSGERSQHIINSWSGVMLWKTQSPFRLMHKKKNWFFQCKTIERDDSCFDVLIKYETCRASGAGGQHVNTTDSAVKATHVETGISVRSESERSQHANKRIAKALLLQKLADKKQESMLQASKQAWLNHLELERGNPVKVFQGAKFELLKGR
jgi:peptide chain release factor